MGRLKTLVEVLRGLKRKKPAPKFCPRCGSPKLRVSSGFDAYPRLYGITPTKYVCENCGYRGPIAMEIEEEKSPSAKSVSNQKTGR